jgi:hypothetical protein
MTEVATEINPFKLFAPQPQAAFEDNACEVSSNDACEVSSNASTACEIAEPQAAPKTSEYKLYTPQPQAAPESNAFKLFAPQPQPRGLKPGPMDYCRPCPVKQDTTKALTVSFKFDALMGFPGTKTISSQRSKVTFTNAPPWGDDDHMFFRLVLTSGEKDGVACHQLQMHMEGRCAAGYYQIALYSQDERWDFHVPAKAYIRSVADTDVCVPKNHALWSEVAFEDVEVKCILRMKPNDHDDSPLVNLCGCC